MAFHAPGVKKEASGGWGLKPQTHELYLRPTGKGRPPVHRPRSINPFPTPSPRAPAFHFHPTRNLAAEPCYHTQLVGYAGWERTDGFHRPKRQKHRSRQGSTN